MVTARHFSHSNRAGKSVTACVNKKFSHFAAAESIITPRNRSEPVNINAASALPPLVFYFTMSFLVYNINQDGGSLKFRVSCALCKGRRAFVVSPADWRSLLFLFDR